MFLPSGMVALQSDEEQILIINSAEEGRQFFRLLLSSVIMPFTA
jgi:hypothetical protein